jgi:hypothetical protein
VITATYTKLRDAAWGIRVQVIWSGSGTHLCTFTESSAKRLGSGSVSLRPTRGRRSCVSGGNCSSFGSGRSCGAEDCDGY